MKIDQKENRRKAGLANYQKRLEKVGLENIKKIGRENAMKRKTFSGGCVNTTFASEIGKVGGTLSRRGRSFTDQTKMLKDEWAMLKELANRTAGNLRLAGRCDAVDQHTLTNLNMQNAYEHGCWIWVMRDGLDLPEWYSALGAEIESKRVVYVEWLKSGVKLTEEQENAFRVIRNLKAAWKVAGEVEYGEAQRETYTWVVR